MSIQPQTFAFSERYLANRRRFMYALAATMVVLILFGMLTAVDFDTRRLASSAPILVVVVALVLILFIIQTRYIQGQWRQMKLHFGPDGLVREAGTGQQVVTWNSIAKVRYRYNPRGEPRAIEVFTANGPPLMLFGYEPMSEVVRLMKDGIPSTAQVKIKRQWLNWENPIVMLAGILLATVVFEAIRRIGGRAVYEIISPLILIALGVRFLSYGPLSRTNPNFRKWEIAFGILIMVFALLRLTVKVVELAR